MNKLLATVLLAFGLVTVSVTRAEPKSAVDDEVLALLRVVEDKDGFTNVRVAASVKSEVVGKLNTGSVVAVEAMKGDWAKLADDSGRNRPQFVHSSRLKNIKGWQQSKGKADGKSAAATTGTLEVKVTEMVFVKDDHKITKDENGQALVDGRTIWGRDGGLPVAGISLTVMLDGKAVAVPNAATWDLYEPNLDSLIVLTPGKFAGHALVMMQNSDGAGAYGVVWAFADGKYVGRTAFTLD